MFCDVDGALPALNGAEHRSCCSSFFFPPHFFFFSLPPARFLPDQQERKPRDGQCSSDRNRERDERKRWRGIAIPFLISRARVVVRESFERIRKSNRQFTNRERRVPRVNWSSCWDRGGTKMIIVSSVLLLLAVVSRVGECLTFLWTALLLSSPIYHSYSYAMTQWDIIQHFESIFFFFFFLYRIFNQAFSLYYIIV